MIYRLITLCLLGAWLACPATLMAQNKQVTQAEYFWDTDPGQGNGTALTAVDGNFSDAIEAVLLNTSTLPANGKLHIQLSDILGRPVQQWTASVSGSTLLIPIAHLQAGQYVLQVISTDNQHHTFKFIR